MFDKSEWQRRYRLTQKGKAVQHRYATSVAGKTTQQRYAAANPERIRESKRRYANSSAGCAARLRWEQAHPDEVVKTKRRYAAANPERIRESQRRYAKSPHGREVLRKLRFKDPAKYKARMAVNNAVRDRRLPKTPCVVCGAVKSQAHHKDYNKPLEVTWLCVKHHRQRDREEQRRKNKSRGHTIVNC